MKICFKCKKDKPTSEFYTDKRNLSRLYSYCKNCQSEYSYAIQKRHFISIKNNYGLGAGTIQRYGFKLALDVYERAGRKCELCDEVNDLTLHHKDGLGRGFQEKGGTPNNNPENLQVLCRKCHGSIEGRRGKGISHKLKSK